MSDLFLIPRPSHSHSNNNRVAKQASTTRHKRTRSSLQMAFKENIKLMNTKAFCDQPMLPL